MHDCNKTEKGLKKYEKENSENQKKLPVGAGLLSDRFSDTCSFREREKQRYTVAEEWPAEGKGNQAG